MTFLLNLILILVCCVLSEDEECLSMSIQETNESRFPSFKLNFLSKMKKYKVDNQEDKILAEQKKLFEKI